MTLADGKTIPVSVASFASRDHGTGRPYLVMALPSVWVSAHVESGLGVEDLTTGVMFHELTHAYEAEAVTGALEALTRKYDLPEDVDDDSLQRAFESNPSYVADYVAERDLLYAAAHAPTDAGARRLAGQALARMTARRSRHFTGGEAKWAGLDEVFLTMEGLGQWTMYAWLTDRRGRGMEAGKALREVRRKRNHWSQDEGLAAFLVIDRLVDHWPSRVLGPHAETVSALLERAASLERIRFTEPSR